MKPSIRTKGKQTMEAKDEDLGLVLVGVSGCE